MGPQVAVSKLEEKTYQVDIVATKDVQNVNVKTEDGIATFIWNDDRLETDIPTVGKTFSMATNETYSFLVKGEENLSASDFRIINQQKGYTYSFYLMAVILILLMFVTFATTKERIKPPKAQKSNIMQDIKDLLNNRAWFTLLITALFSSTYNALKQGIIIIYFTHYLHNQLLAASYLVGLMLVSIVGAIVMTPLSVRFGKRNLFIASLLLSGAFISLIIFCGSGMAVVIFILRLLSELIGALFSSLTFVMLGDAADYSEWKNKRRATGLVYSAGSFSTKFGGGIAGAIIGVVLSKYGYDGLDPTAIQGAIPGIKMLMSWIPTIVALIGAITMMFYPLSKKMMNKISEELEERRRLEKSVVID